MLSPLQRLYKTKFALLAVISAFLGLALILLAHWATVGADGSWLRDWPVNDIGLGLFTTGLFGVLFQYVGQRDAEEASLQRIRDVITEDLAAKPDGLASLVSADTRDRIIRNCLGVQLGDRALADEVFADLRGQLARTEERRYNMDVSVTLAPWTGDTATTKGPMFVATVRWEYQVVPASPVMRFACVSDLDEYRDLLQDPSATIVWYFEPIGILTGASEDAFCILQFTVDDRQLPIRRAARAASQVYTANLDKAAADGRKITVSYTYQVLVQQHGHLIHLDISKPTKGLKVRFDYGNCGIRHVNVVDYIASSIQPRLSRPPASGPAPSIQLGFDGWVLPKAGVGFVWVLDGEFGPDARKRSL